jgi:hypothetical protein
MSSIAISTLKTNFGDGKYPTGSDFTDFIDTTIDLTKQTGTLSATQVSDNGSGNLKDKLDDYDTYFATLSDIDISVTLPLSDSSVHDALVRIDAKTASDIDATGPTAGGGTVQSHLDYLYESVVSVDATEVATNPAISISNNGTPADANDVQTALTRLNSKRANDIMDETNSITVQQSLNLKVAYTQYGTQTGDSTTLGVLLTSEDGSVFALYVDNSGVLHTAGPIV